MEFKKTYSICVFNSNVDDADFSIVDGRDKYFSRNNEVEMYILLSEKELSDSSIIDVLDIINKDNNSMIGLDEDDVIYSQEIREKCFIKLDEYCQHKECNETITKLKELFKLAIKNNKNIYFIF